MQEIYLEGALPAQSKLLVTDSATEAHSEFTGTTSDPAVVLAGKMTLSVISLDSAQENRKSFSSSSENAIVYFHRFRHE